MSQQLDGGDGGQPRSIPEATVARLAVYQRALTLLSGPTDSAQLRSAANGTATGSAAISSEALATLAGVSPSTLRKDLSYLGSHGVRGVGYDTDVLIGEIGRVLGATRQHRVALVGVGNLGAALANYRGIRSRGLVIAALLDTDPARIGQRIGGVEVEDMADVMAVCRREQVSIGVIATPEGAAQTAADALVRAGVTAILTFTPGVIQVPDDVELRRVDLAVELQVLAFHASRRAVPAPVDFIAVSPAAAGWTASAADSDVHLAATGPSSRSLR